MYRSTGSYRPQEAMSLPCCIDRSFLKQERYQVDLSKFDCNNHPGGGSCKESNSTEQNLGINYIPHKFDVISSKGRYAYNHVGNRRFRITLALFKKKYESALSKAAKSCVVDEIVQTVYCCHGRFIRFSTDNMEWIASSDNIARDKAGHAIRAIIVGHRRRSSTSSAKKRRRRSSSSSVSPSDSVRARIECGGDNNFEAIFNDIGLMPSSDVL